MNSAKLFQTAVSKAKAGERTVARDMLLRLVEAQPEHELAWLWLSELVVEPEDKIIALENALTINPQRTMAIKRLETLRQLYPTAALQPDYSFSANGSISIPTTEQTKLEKINQLLASGNIDIGREQLASFLRRYSDSEAGWWLLVQHADSQDNLLTGLDHLLRLNPQHHEAPDLLAEIKPNRDESYQVGRLYERLEEWDRAIYHYKQALKSPTNADRLLAKKRLPHVEEQLKLANIKDTSPTLTVLRLAIGPTLLYGMLILVQAGLNPLRLSPLLCLSNLLFLAGLLLMGGLTYGPDHPWMDRLRGTAVWQNKTVLRFVGILFVLVPIILLILQAISRLLAFNLDLESLL